MPGSVANGRAGPLPGEKLKPAAMATPPVPKLSGADCNALDCFKRFGADVKPFGEKPERA